MVSEFMTGNWGYKLELLSRETMKVLESIKEDFDQDKDGGNFPKLEYIEVFLVHFNWVNNKYPKPSKVLFTFLPNKKFG